eukprot:gene12981-8831_t
MFHQNRCYFFAYRPQFPLFDGYRTAAARLDHMLLPTRIKQLPHLAFHFICCVMLLFNLFSSIFGITASTNNNKYK